MRQVVIETSRLVHGSIAPGVRVRLDLDKHLPPLLADPGQILADDGSGASWDPIKVEGEVASGEDVVGEDVAESDLVAAARVMPALWDKARREMAPGSRLVSALPAPDRNWDFTFHVLEDKTVNAFAVPGGNMFLFTGLYKAMTTDDALAAVTGHEMAHVYRQH